MPNPEEGQVPADVAQERAEWSNLVIHSDGDLPDSSLQDSTTDDGE